MSREDNIRAILESHFTGFKDEIIDNAVKCIMGLGECSEFVYGYSVKELIAFASICRDQGVGEYELHNFVTNANLGFRLGAEQWQKQLEKQMNELMKGAEDDKGNTI